MNGDELSLAAWRRVVRPALRRRVSISGRVMKMHPFPLFIGCYPLSVIRLGQVIRRGDFNHNGDQVSLSNPTAERGVVMGRALGLTEIANWSRKLGVVEPKLIALRA